MTTKNIPEQIRRQWEAAQIAIVVRAGLMGKKLIVRLPFRDDNAQWIRSLATGTRRPEVSWDSTYGAWKLPASWLNRFVEGALNRYGRLYVVQPFREMEKCAPACRDANGHECQCSCMGANHGNKDGLGWFDISETFSFRWGLEQAAIRLMSKKL